MTVAVPPAAGCPKPHRAVLLRKLPVSVWKDIVARQLRALHVDTIRGKILVFGLDRKSTRLNSSHLVISYAVFCLKKKNSSAHGLQRRPSRASLTSASAYSAAVTSVPQ